MYKTTIVFVFQYKKMGIIVAVEYEGHPESKARLRKQSAYLFCRSRKLFSGVQCDVEKLLHAVVRRTLSHGCAD